MPGSGGYFIHDIINGIKGINSMDGHEAAEDSAVVTVTCCPGIADFKGFFPYAAVPGAVGERKTGNRFADKVFL